MYCTDPGLKGITTGASTKPRSATVSAASRQASVAVGSSLANRAVAGVRDREITRATKAGWYSR